MSPSRRTLLDDGIPCTTSSLIEIHSEAGNPWYARCDVATHLGQRPAHEKIVLTEQLYLFFSF